ncbi:sugar ABC transporter substrate-binding protein [Bacillota bacterium Meth-B3]|nr:sugar ABC transporter substrate-binding protein [Christensenellaceae bacterium]MEA5066524.1 sugar ABC transporter substrate-binding protein [Eubacteriales bacterium]MEA5069660.1 sugar ABC transporter substrate-binding protein [Christensenellaceae bacterium]
MKRILGIALVLLLALGMLPGAALAQEGKALKVAYIPNSMSNESLAYGFKMLQQYAADYNIEVTAFDGQFNAQVEVATITNCIGQGYDALILCPSDINAVIPAVMEAKEAGLIVALYAADLAEEYQSLRDIFCGVNDNSAGEEAGKAFVARFPDGANVVEIGGQAGTDAQNRRHDGFGAATAGSKINVLSYQACDAWATASAMAIMEDMIVKFGDQIQGVFCHWDNGATGVIEALKNAKMEGVYVVAVDGCRAGFDQVKAGTQSVCISQSFKNMSIRTLECIRSAADGQSFEAVNFIPLDVVTAENIDTFDYPEW